MAYAIDPSQKEIDKLNFDLAVAGSIVRLWKLYCSDKNVRENTNLVSGSPVFNANGFILWLKEKK